MQTTPCVWRPQAPREVPGLEMICTFGLELGDGARARSRRPARRTGGATGISGRKGTVMFLNAVASRGADQAIEAHLRARHSRFSTAWSPSAGLENAEGVDALNRLPRG